MPWPELLGALFQASQSTDPGQRETAFRIFSTTPGIIEKQHEDVVMSAFKGGFADSSTSVATRMLAQHAQPLTDFAGPHFSRRGFCVILPIYHQEGSAKVLPAHFGSAEHSSPD